MADLLTSFGEVDELLIDEGRGCTRSSASPYVVKAHGTDIFLLLHFLSILQTPARRKPASATWIARCWHVHSWPTALSTAWPLTLVLPRSVARSRGLEVVVLTPCVSSVFSSSGRAADSPITISASASTHQAVSYIAACLAARGLGARGGGRTRCVARQGVVAAVYVRLSSKSLSLSCPTSPHSRQHSLGRDVNGAGAEPTLRDPSGNARHARYLRGELQQRNRAGQDCR